MFGIKRKLKNFSIILEGNSKRMGCVYEYLNDILTRLDNVERITEDFKKSIAKLRGENTNLKSESERVKKNLWKLENPPIYRVGDTPNATLTIISIELMEQIFSISSEDSNGIYANSIQSYSSPLICFYWEYKAFDSKTKTIKVSHGKF